MRIGMIGYDMQEFGGLEEYAVNLAMGLKQQGHELSYVSCAWVAPENQYALNLRRIIFHSFNRRNGFQSLPPIGIPRKKFCAGS